MSLPKLLLRTFKPFTFALITLLIYLSYQHYERSQALAKSQSQDNVKVASALVWSQIEATFAKVDLLQESTDSNSFDILTNQILANSFLYKSIALYNTKTKYYSNFNDDGLTDSSQASIRWHSFDGFAHRYAVSTLYQKADGFWVFAIKQEQDQSPVEVWFEIDVQHTTQYLANLKTLDNGYVFVIDKMTGQLVFHPNPARIGTASISYFGGLQDQVEAGETRGQYDYFYNGNLKKSVFSAQNPMGWVFVSGTSQTDILFTSYQISLTAVVILALLLLVFSINYITYQLNEALSELTRAEDIAQFKHDLKIIFDRFTYHKGVQFCLFDAETHYFKTIDFHGNSKSIFHCERLPRVFESRGLNFLYNNKHDPLAQKLHITGRHYTLALYNQDALIGVIYLKSSFYAFEGLIRAIRDFSEVALANLLLTKKVAMDDALTGLENEWSMRNHIAVSESNNAMFYAVVDINGLKGINEKYGEHTGDSVVVHVADIARRSFPKPKATCIARGQNGCISVLFHTSHIEDAEKQMDWFRQLVEKQPLDVDEGSIQATVSIGLTQLGDSVDATLSRGIKSLQQSKLKGRNQVYSCKIA